MKRCPQCEFIYEDDQSLCDMDGVLLVLDSRILPTQALVTVPAKPPRRKNRAVPAFATLTLALVLGMVYYVTTRPNAVPTIDPPASATSIPNPAPAVTNPTPEAQPSESPKEEEEEEAKSTTPKQPAVAPAKKPAAAAKTPASVPQTKTSVQPKKDESKVGSILKKTGRILKKPFKF